MPNKIHELVSGEDEFWIRAYFQSGDSEYWGRIFEKYKKRIFLRCLTLLQDNEDASDLTSETFIKAHENIQKYDMKRPFFPWLQQIATNLCIDLLRRKTIIQFTQTDEKIEFHSAEDVTKKVENRELGDTILKALKSLKNHQKRCFCLFYIHRKSYKEIAELTGYSYNDVRSYIQNGKRKFKLVMQA